ncbi:MAG: hypothetical protein HYT61_01600 [Candidatus Yanofskybacteria bacterium]|nr:hypothetical protein [Candidatus Yanofskybacteria bacterium]
MVENSVEERENKIKKELERARPAIVVSCSDGILLATLNNLRKPKIKQVSGPTAFIGVGIWSDFNKLWEFASASLIAHRFVNASERDFTILDKIIETLCREIRQKFCNLYSADYYQCELILAFLGEDKSNDRFYSIDCAGIEGSSSSFFMIPTVNAVTPPGLSVLNNSTTMQAALRTVADVMEEELRANHGALEVSVLSRDVLLGGKPEETYHKLTSEEIQNWLS